MKNYNNTWTETKCLPAWKHPTSSLALLLSSVSAEHRWCSELLLLLCCSCSVCREMRFCWRLKLTWSFSLIQQNIMLSRPLQSLLIWFMTFEANNRAWEWNQVFYSEASNSVHTLLIYYLFQQQLFISRFSSFVDVMERKLTATRRQKCNIVETKSCSWNLRCFIHLYSNKLCLMWRCLQDQFLLHLYTLCYDCSQCFTMSSSALFIMIFISFSLRCFKQILQISCDMFGCSKKI